jgi:hypothetical protein
VTEQERTNTLLERIAAQLERRQVAEVGRGALRIDEACTWLGIGRTAFEEHVLPEVRVIRRGRLRLIPLPELERWRDENAAMTLQRTA